jgi:hypothetical protein
MDRERRPYYVYRLRCPIDNRIRYIGISADPHRRIYAHQAKKTWGIPSKQEWITRLRSENLLPSIEIVSPPLPYDEALAWELRLQFLFSTIYPRQLVCSPVRLRRHTPMVFMLSPQKAGNAEKRKSIFFLD